MTKDSLPSQSTTLEALLRGEGLDRRNNSKNDEESLLEIQVRSVRTPSPIPQTSTLTSSALCSDVGRTAGAPALEGLPPSKRASSCQVYPADLQGSLAQRSFEFSFTDDRYIIWAVNSSTMT